MNRANVELAVLFLLVVLGTFILAYAFTHS